MYNRYKPSENDLPTSTELLKSTIIALFIAGALLICIVLPAEYGTDPTGVGEFLGLIKLSSHGAKIINEKFEYLLANHTGTFHNAPSLKKAYITDFIQELVNSKIVITPIFISGKWCEIDTNQDLERAQKMFL